jgi:DNA polymerase III subunit chi
MVQVWFYHLERTPLISALPELLEKVIDKGWRAYVLGQGPETLNTLDQHLWTFKSEGFIGHGREHEAFAERQPVLLGESGKPVNDPQVLMSVSAMDLPELNAYKRVLILFEAQNQLHLDWARGQWKTYKAQNLDLAYWKQNEHGRWERAQ